MNIVDTTDKAVQEFLAKKLREYVITHSKHKVAHSHLSWEKFREQYPVKYSQFKLQVRRVLATLCDEGCYVITDATVGLGQEETDVSVRKAVRRTHLTPAREVQRLTVKVNKPREKSALRRELQKQRERKGR